MDVEADPSSVGQRPKFNLCKAISLLEKQVEWIVVEKVGVMSVRVREMFLYAGQVQSCRRERYCDNSTCLAVDATSPPPDSL